VRRLPAFLVAVVMVVGFGMSVYVTQNHHIIPQNCYFTQDYFAVPTDGSFAGVGDPTAQPPADAETYRVPRWVGFGGPSVSPVPKGPVLFEKVRATIARHIRFEEEWMLDLSALWVLQAYLADSLPSVFYLLLSATKGKAKTATLDLLSALTGALNASDISVAALVHWLEEHPFGPVTIDEMDVARDAERDSAIAAICRNGYTPGKQYLRWDASARRVDDCPTYSAKAIGFRDKVDDALEDRGFQVAAGLVPGREGAKLVLQNFHRDVGDLPEQLAKWSKLPRLKEAIAAEMEKESWMEKVEEVVGQDNIGANRETQLTMVALAVCRAACIDLTPSLRAAVGLRREVAAANTDEDVEEALEVLENMITSVGTLMKETETYVVRQKAFADAFNARRMEKGLRRLTSKQLVRLRNDIGISPTWLTSPKNKKTWNIPAKEWDALSRRGVANPPNPPNPVVLDGGVRWVSQVRSPPPEAAANVRLLFKRAAPDPVAWLPARPELARTTGIPEAEYEAAVAIMLDVGELIQVSEGVFRLGGTEP
jgi:hypothetical protein